MRETSVHHGAEWTFTLSEMRSCATELGWVPALQAPDEALARRVAEQMRPVAATRSPGESEVQLEPHQARIPQGRVGSVPPVLINLQRLEGLAPGTRQRVRIAQRPRDAEDRAARSRGSSASTSRMTSSIRAGASGDRRKGTGTAGGPRANPDPRPFPRTFEVPGESVLGPPRTSYAHLSPRG
jgi:hypothetical protein